MAAVFTFLIYFTGVVLSFLLMRYITNKEKIRRDWFVVFMSLILSSLSFVTLGVILLVSGIVLIIKKMPSDPPDWM